MKYSVRSGAKINLSLDILRQRPDGYHELASLVHPVGLWDELEISISEDELVGFSFECSRPDLGGDDNLCCRAVRLWQQATESSFRVHIALQKNIPDGAGLGGGSGNAAAVLATLNRHFESLPSPELEALGARLGADVPLFLRNSAVLMEGIGEKLTSVPPLQGWILGIKPALSLSTPAVYRAWDGEGFESERKTATLLKAWQTGDLIQVSQNLGNDLERAASVLSPLPQVCVELLREVGGLGAQMSGSGSSCFGIFISEAKALVAKQQLSALVAKDLRISAPQVFIAPLVTHGIEIETNEIERETT